MVDYLRNIEAWAVKDPKHAFHLSNCEPEELGEAKEELSGWPERFDQGEAEILYVYGIGAGGIFLQAKKWLEEGKERRLVFIEDDLKNIGRFMLSENAEPFLRHPRAELCFMPHIEKDRTGLQGLFLEFVLKPFKVLAHPDYLKEKKERFELLKNRLMHESEQRDALLEEYLQRGIVFFRNYYCNMLQLPRSYEGAKLAGKFKGVPAIICGAGPSLQKNIALLETLQERAVIFGGGSSLNALHAAGMLPHFGVGLDPNPAQEERLSVSGATGVPFFYRNRMFHPAFKLIEGPRLYTPGSGGFDISHYFDKRFGLEGHWEDIGHNVVNFSLRIAKELGCNPLILVGVDLAYSGRKSYADGVVADPSLSDSDLKGCTFKRNNIFGEEVHTDWKWLSESEWIAEFAEENPELKVINCTEGGLGMRGVPNLPLKEAAEKHLKKSYPLKERIEEAIRQAGRIAATAEEVVRAMEELKESLSRCMQHLDILIEDLASGGEAQSGRAALAEIELAEEPGFSYVLHVFNEAFGCIINQQMRRLEEGTAERAQLNLERLSFVRNVAKTNCELLDLALAG